MGDQATLPVDLVAQWTAARNALAGQDPDQLDWSTCQAMIDACSALGGAGMPPDAQWAHPLPLPKPGPARQTGGWARFAAADAALKLCLTRVWTEAAGDTAAVLGKALPTAPEAIRVWADALDKRYLSLVSSADFPPVQTEWLRAALECEAWIAPVTLPVPVPVPPNAPQIALTPKRKIWQSGESRLFRYTAPSEGDIPLLIVHGLIGRQTVTDLQADCSLVRDLQQDGHDLWVMDWGNPGRAEAGLDFTHYADRMLGRAVASIRRDTGRKPALLGICQGGVFVLCHAARRPGALAGVALTGTPVDFHADLAADVQEGYLNRLTRSLPHDVIEGLLARNDMLPGSLTGALFQGMTPGRTFAKYALGPIERQGPAALTFARMETWLADRPDVPGAVAREWLCGLFQDNQLVKRRFVIAGEPIDLGAIRCPVLNVIARRDHIVPPACSRALGILVDRSRYEELTLDTGHIGVFVSRHGRPVFTAHLAEWLTKLSNTL